MINGFFSNTAHIFCSATFHDYSTKNILKEAAEPTYHEYV